MRHTIALRVAAALPLAACTPQIPQINYDDPAALHTEPPKPVRIVQMPELLPLPGQLKRMPRGGQPASASEPAIRLAACSSPTPPPASNRHAPATSMRSRSTPTATGRCTALRRSSARHRHRPRARRGAEGGRRRGHDPGRSGTPRAGRGPPVKLTCWSSRSPPTCR